MISKYNHRGLSWIDLEAPSDDEISYIFDEYSTPLFTKDEIFTRPKEDIIRMEYGYIYAYLNVQSDNRLIFVISDNFIIIIHDKPINALREFSKELELDTFTEEKFDTKNNKMLFAHLFKRLYVDSHRDLESKKNLIQNYTELLIKNDKKIKLLTILTISSLIVIIILFVYAIIRI